MNNLQYQNQPNSQWTFPADSDDGNLLQQQALLQQQQAQLQKQQAQQAQWQQHQKEQQAKILQQELLLQQQQQQWMAANGGAPSMGTPSMGGYQQQPPQSNGSIFDYSRPAQSMFKQKQTNFMEFLKEYWMMITIALFIIILFLYYACDIQQSVSKTFSPGKRKCSNIYAALDEDIESTVTEMTKTYLL